MSEKIENSKNLIPAIGLFLILAVAFFTFLRPVLNKNNSKEKDRTKTENMPEKSASKMTAEELFKKITAKESVNILDIRPEEAFKKEHLKNSKNISAETVSRLIEKEKFYVLVDEGISGEARNLAANLKDDSYPNVFYLEGGFQNWKDGSFPTISEGNPDSIVDRSKVTYIPIDSLKNTMDNDKNLLVIDVRNSDIFSQEHLKNAINIPLSELEERKNEISFGKKTILYDNNGLLAFQGAVRLFDLNIFNVFILSGGLDAWKQKGYEIIK